MTRVGFIVMLGVGALACSKDGGPPRPRKVSYAVQPRVEELEPRPVGSGEPAASSPRGESAPLFPTDAGADAEPVDAGPPRAFGVQCTDDDQCESRFCLATGICSKSCGTATDCLAAPEWSCLAVPAVGRRCMCVATGTERCDGRDNDCNALVDDSCDGGP